MAAEINIVINAQDNASAALGNFGSVITGIESAINLMSQAFDAAVGFVQPFIDSAMEGEEAIARLEGVLRATGGAAGVSSDQLQQMAGALQDVTRFSDETILNGASLLLTFRNIGSETLERAIPAMLDMAEIFGSVDSAAMQLGKALNEPLTMLGSLQRAGVTFSEEQRTMIENFVEMGDIASAQAIILAEVEAQVGGLAEAMGQTFAGQLEIVRNRLDEVRESIGTALLPILGDLLEQFNDFMESPAVQNFLDSVIEAINTGDFSGLWDMILGGINNVDWEQVSRDLAEGLNSIDWGLVSQGVGDISSLFTEILTEIDWSAVAGAIWESLIQAFTVVIDNGANALLELLADAFGDPDVATFQAGVQAGAARLGDILLTTLFPPNLGFQLADQMRDIAGDMIDGLWQGWEDAFDSIGLGGIADWWQDHIIDPVKRVLGISSPSTVFAGIGRDIITGLMNGMESMLDNLADFVGDVVDIILAPFTGGSTGTIGGATGGAGGVGAGGGGLGSSNQPMPGNGSSTGTGSGAVLNFYGPVYVGSLNELNYDCGSVSPLLQSSIGLSGNSIG